MKLGIVIPAYNEEDAIGQTIQRTLEAKENIIAQSPISEIEVIVVSDGSTDRTVEIASEYENVKTIVFEKNRGYGAAIKEGFSQSSGDVLGFLDADGTCDPNFFAELCSALEDEHADIAIGSRMGPDSKMPLVRRIGNKMYALLLGMLGNQRVGDAASGMRIIRSKSLEKLLPLPDGLNFTPAMSTRAVLDRELKIIELPMPYSERIGRSKLSVFRDGFRFFYTIIELALMYCPFRIFGATALFCVLAGILIGLYPLEYYLTNQGFLEWMIYRFLLCSLLGSFAITLLVFGTICEKLLDILIGKRPEPTFLMGITSGLLSNRWIWAVAGLLTCASFALVSPGLKQLFTTGRVQMHWSRAVVGSFGIFSAFQISIGAICFRLLEMVEKSRKT